jgi:hypothetical protein
MPITPTYYAQVYQRCRAAIRALTGHESDVVITAAVAPWNMESGDWLAYLGEVLTYLGEGVDGIGLHAYTHGAEPDLIGSDERRHDWLWHFRTYRDQIGVIPACLRGKPLYITESNQGGPWANANSGWVQAAYQEIDAWNQSGGQPIHCLALYRWGKYDQWAIDGKPGVLGDLHAAMSHGYVRPEAPPPLPPVPPLPPSLEERIRALEERVGKLEGAIPDLRKDVGTALGNAAASLLE